MVLNVLLLLYSPRTSVTDKQNANVTQEEFKGHVLQMPIARTALASVAAAAPEKLETIDSASRAKAKSQGFVLVRQTLIVHATVAIPLEARAQSVEFLVPQVETNAVQYHV